MFTKLTRICLTVFISLVDPGFYVTFSKFSRELPLMEFQKKKSIKIFKRKKVRILHVKNQNSTSITGLTATMMELW